MSVFLENDPETEHMMVLVIIDINVMLLWNSVAIFM